MLNDDAGQNKRPASEPRGWGHLLAALAVVAAYNLLFFNRFMPLTEGWFTAYAQRMHEGAIPYRDFYFYLPPAYLWLISKYTLWFGEGILALRILGVGIILLFAAGLWVLLRRHFRPWVAAVAAVVGTIYYQTGNAHIQYDFIQVMNAAVVWALVCLQRWDGADQASGAWWAALAGALAATAALVKQSNGGLIFAFAGCAAAVAGMHRGWRESLRGALAYAAGAGIPVGLCATWLWAHSAFDAAVAQLWGGALAAKGSLWVILFTAWKNLYEGGVVHQLLVVAGVLLLGGGWRLFLPFLCGRQGPAEPGLLATRWGGPVLFLFGVAAIGVPWVNPAFSGRFAAEFSTSEYPNYVIPAAFAGFLLAVIAGLSGWIAKEAKPRAFLVPALVMLGVIWGNGTSAGYTEAGMYLGLAYLAGFVLTDGGWSGLGRWAALGVGLASLMIWAEIKYAKPYHWWGVEEADVRGALVAPPHPLQAGMRVSAGTGRVYREVLALLEGEVKPGEPMLVYPHVPIFNVLTGTRAIGRAIVDWFDFLPDEAARAEAELVKRTPPPAVVYFDMPDLVRDTHERLFRAGRPSGQRAIEDALRAQVAAGVYREKGRVEVSPGYVLRVLVKGPAAAR